MREQGFQRTMPKRRKKMKSKKSKWTPILRGGKPTEFEILVFWSACLNKWVTVPGVSKLRTV